MTDELQRLISDLDNKVPKGNAKVLIRQYGGGPDESEIVANELGYLRLGIEFLKAASADSINANGRSLDVELKYLISENSDVSFDNFERTEDVAGWEAAKPTLVQRLIPIGCMGILVIIAVLCFVGLMVAIDWIRH